LVPVAGVARDEVGCLRTNRGERPGSAGGESRSVVVLADEDHDTGVLACEIDLLLEYRSFPLREGERDNVLLHQQLMTDDTAVVLVHEDGSDRGRVDLGNRPRQHSHLLLDLPDLDPRLALGIGHHREEAEEERSIVVGRLDVERPRAARISRRCRITVMVERVVEADPGEGIGIRPVPPAVEDDSNVVGFLLLQVSRPRVTRRVTGVLKRRRLDRRICGYRVAELEGAADELRPAGEGAASTSVCRRLVWTYQFPTSTTTTLSVRNSGSRRATSTRIAPCSLEGPVLRLFAACVERPVNRVPRSPQIRRTIPLPLVLPLVLP